MKRFFQIFHTLSWLRLAAKVCRNAPFWTKCLKSCTQIVISMTFCMHVPTMPTPEEQIPPFYICRQWPPHSVANNAGPAHLLSSLLLSCYMVSSKQVRPEQITTCSEQSCQTGSSLFDMNKHWMHAYTPSMAVSWTKTHLQSPHVFQKHHR